MNATLTGPFLRTQVQWDPALLEAPLDEAVEAWKRSLHGFAKRLTPDRQAAFLMELDSACYFMHGESACAANGGVHPKHRLIGYHEFFCGRVAAGERVLDLGSGVGALAASLARRGAVVTGVDWSRVNIQTAQEIARHEGLDPAPVFHLGDITSFRAPGTFDTVILSNVLEHVADRSRRLAMWAQWYSPRRFLIRVPAFDRDWRVAWKKELGVEWRCDVTHEIEHTRGELLAEVREAGLAAGEVLCAWGEYLVEARASGLGDKRESGSGEVHG